MIKLGSALRGAALAGIMAATMVPALAKAQAADTMAAIRARGQLICGVSTNAPGFALPDSRGEFRGLDVDTCRAVAAALFGDANKVRFVPTTTVQRFPMLQSGELDILVRNTTWTMARESALWVSEKTD